MAIADRPALAERALAGGEAVYGLMTQSGSGQDTRVADGSIQFRGDRRPKGSDLLARITPQAMMIVLKALEEQGPIACSPHPRHLDVLELHVTDPGREALDEGQQRVEPVKRRVIDSFSAIRRI